MTIKDKLQFWKKHDDYSFDESSFDKDINADPFTNNEQPIGNTQTGLPPLDSDENNPYAQDPAYAQVSKSPSDTFSQQPSPPPSQDFTSSSFGGSSKDSMSFPQEQSPEFPPSFPSQTPTPGQSMARDYVKQQEAPPQNRFSPEQNLMSQNNSSQSMEVLNLKIDAMKSELDAMAQRLIKIEHLVEKMSKTRGW